MYYDFKVFICNWVVRELDREKNDKRIKLDEYVQNKIDCFEDSYSDILADISKISYFRLLSRHVHKNEVAFGKDLKYFTSVEIEEVINGVVTSSHTTKRSLFAAINYYMNWNVTRKEISYNPCDSIDTTNLFEVNSRIAKKQYMEIDEFNLFVENLIATDIEKMVITLIRYGVPTSEVPNVRWEDLDKKKGVLRANVKGNDIELPVDEDFINRVEMAKACIGKPNKKDKSVITEYIDSGYMIKGEKEGQVSVTNIYDTIRRICRSNDIGKIDVSMLAKNRKFDFALDVYRLKNEITQEELKSILEELGLPSSPNRVFMFKSELEDIFNIEVTVLREPYTSKPIDVIDVATGEILGTFKSIKALSRECEEKLGMYIDKGAVSKIASGKTDRTTYKGLTFRYANEE